MRLLAPSRGTHTYWNDKDPVIYEGVIGLTKDRLFPGSLEYFIGDGVHKYSELPKYGGAEASYNKKNNTLVLRGSDGLIDPDSIPASTTAKANNVVKADGNGSLNGWREAISNAVADPSAGLIVGADGKLNVDFDQMPTTKFEALLKSLKMQIPLESTLNLYVDKNHASAADTIEDGRGTQNKPFKTIQACVNYATQTYAVGSNHINIYIAQATYSEAVSLPVYTRTSGEIYLRALNDDAPPTITNPTAISFPLRVYGGSWILRRLNIVGNFSDPDNGLYNAPSTIASYGGDTDVTIQGCSISAQYTGSAPSTGSVNIQMLLATTGSAITFGVVSEYGNSLTCNKNNANTAVFMRCDETSRIRIPSANIADTGVEYKIQCAGSANTFALVTRNSAISAIGGGLYEQTFNGVVSAKKYDITGGSGVSAPENGFPGTTTGTVEDATYSWYKE